MDYGQNPFLKNKQSTTASTHDAKKLVASKVPNNKPIRRSSHSLHRLPIGLIALGFCTVAFVLYLAFFRTTTPIGMVQIQAGCFEMGSPNDEQLSLNAEHPKHQVCLNSFLMDQNEVTQAEFLKVMGINPSHFQGCANCPVEMVSWFDAMDYCKKMDKRLPTEAEWEYASRAGSTTTYPWGQNFEETQAWAVSNSQGTTQPVRTCIANSWGLYDVIGNVWEWTADWADNQYYSHSPVKNPKGPSTGTDRIIRGGSYNAKTRNLRSATRGWANPTDRQSYIGFRCAK